MHPSVILPSPVPIREWRPVLPDGELRAISLHWTGGDYADVYPAYHFCLSGAADVLVHATHDLRNNMRDVAAAPDLPYAAHTAGRNGYCVGIAICAMREATPHDFGRFPLTTAQVDALCLVAAALVRRYDIALANVRTHAEAARDDGYFGDGGDDVRWDIARLEPSATPLQPEEATRVGNMFRARIARL